VGHEGVGWIAVAQGRNTIMPIECGKFVIVGTERIWTVAEISDLKID
jgi:hypothetical protein